MRRIIIGFIMLLISIKGLCAESASAGFLKIVPEARNAALGESSVANADDINSVSINPAGLADAKGIQVVFSHSMWLFDTMMESFAASYQLTKIGTIGLSGRFLLIPDIDDNYDENGNKLPGSIESGDMMIGASYGREIINRLNAGISVKYISENLAGVNGSAIAIDTGLIYKLTKEINIGAAVLNLGSKVSFNDGENDLPMMVKGGIGYKMKFKEGRLLNNLNMGAGLKIPNDNNIDLQAGIELNLGKSKKGFGASLRTGLKSIQGKDFISNLTFGGGIQYSMLGVDYAFFSAGENVGTTHRISLLFKY